MTDLNGMCAWSPPNRKAEFPQNPRILHDEQLRIFRALVKFAEGGVSERLAAPDELADVIEEIVKRRGGT